MLKSSNKAGNTWMPKLKKGGGPVYLAIANAIAEDIAIGQLSAEQRLPPPFFSFGIQVLPALLLDFNINGSCD